MINYDTYFCSQKTRLKITFTNGGVECFNFPEFQFSSLKFDRLVLINIANLLGNMVYRKP